MSRKKKAIARHEQPAAMTAVNVQHQSLFRGPIPPPQVLAGYDSALPGLADRIVRMAEQEAELNRRQFGLAEAQHETERLVTLRVLEDTRHINDQRLALQRRGQVFAFLLTCIGIVGGGSVAAFTQNVWALTAALGPICFGLGVAYLGGRTKLPAGQPKTDQSDGVRPS